MEKRRVVITGMGAVTPIGNNVETFWKNVKEGKKRYRINYQIRYHRL